MFTNALVLTLAWGALSFGAVYQWAYMPLFGALGILGFWGLFGKTESPKRIHWALLIGVTLLTAAVALQLVPLSRQTLLSVSPAADALLLRYDFGYANLAAAGGDIVHPLSIDPAATQSSLVQILALGIFVFGLMRTLDGSKLRLLMPRLILLGFTIAMIGIIQKPLFTGKIYGFWTPAPGPILHVPGGGPFGPFVNRNHFAGWMLMVAPLAIGYFAALVARGMRGSRPGWRERLIWFSSPEASQAVLVAFAILVMSLSLMMTFSRSGISCFIAALAVAGVAAFRRETGLSKRVVVIGFLVLIAVFSLSWAGFEIIAARFESADPTLEGRLFAWQDALRIYRDFPTTGTGLNTYGVATLFYQTFQTDLFHFAEAHNDYLQLLAEGGLLLVTPTVILAGLFIREVRRRFGEGLDDGTGYWLRVGAVTGLVAICLQEIVEFSLQIPGNAALFVLLCGIAVRKSGQRGSPAAAPSIDRRRL